VATGQGTVTDEDIFAYQTTVWSRPEVAGFDELVDMSAVEHIAVQSTERVRELAALSAKMDQPSTVSKFAIVAPQDIAYGLGRMYEAYRELDASTTKHVEVFRRLEDALAYLGLEALP